MHVLDIHVKIQTLHIFDTQIFNMKYKNPGVCIAYMDISRSTTVYINEREIICQKHSQRDMSNACSAS
jgi:hypothetical protein